VNFGRAGSLNFLCTATGNHKDFDPKQHSFVVIPYKLQRK